MTEKRAPATGTGPGNASSRPAFAFDPRWRRLEALFLLLSTSIRLLQLRATNLVPDEAYYWDWSRRPSLGYYDQGPFIAYLIRTTTAVFGTNEFGVRIGVLLCSLGAIILAGYLARRCFSPLAGFLTVLLLGTTPLMEVGSIIATYDPPLVFFWMAAVVLLERALFDYTDRPDSVECSRMWLLAGVATGLGFLSKHTMLILAPSLVLFLALSPRHRFWLTRPAPYLAFATAIVMYSGVIYWNAHHHWWTFGHLLFLTHNGVANNQPWKRVGDFVASQLLLIGPVMFFGLFAGSSRVRQWLRELQPLSNPGQTINEPVTEEVRQSGVKLFLFCMGWPALALFVLMAFRSKVQGNWAVFAWPAPSILWAALLAERWGRVGVVDGTAAPARGVTRAKLLVFSAALTGVLLSTVMVFPAIAFKLGLKLKADNDQTNQFVGWDQTMARVEQVRREMEGGPTGKEHRPVFLVGSGYQYCAMMGFYLPDRPFTYDMFLHYRLDMYAAYVENLTAKIGEDAVFINENRSEDADLRKVFTEVTWDPPLEIYRKPYYSGPIRTVYIARCHRYRFNPGTSWHVGG